MTVNHDAYAAVARDAIDRLLATQREPVVAASRIVADIIGADGVLHVFGTGHSEVVCLELVGRAGGFVPTNKLALSDAGGGGDPQDERDPDFALRVWEKHDIRASDAFVIASNSGGNGSTVEMALLVKRLGIPLIALTSMAHTAAIRSRHPSGKRLFEVADVVIDNQAPYGDAVLATPAGCVCALSSVTSTLAAQLIVADAVGRLLAAGVTPPIYVSANTPGADEVNRRAEARYIGRIHRITG